MRIGPLVRVGTHFDGRSQRVDLIAEPRRIIMSKLTDFRVAVLATNGFEETELTEPVKALKDAGVRVTILSLEPGQIQGVRHDLNKTVRVQVDRATGVG